MNLYLWQYVMHISEHYHDSGGLVVFAESLEEARELIRQNVTTRKETDVCEALTKDPDVSSALKDDVKKGVWLFPDAGCC